MFITCKKAVKIPSGTGFVSLPAGFLGNIDEGLKTHWYFKALCKDGTISFCENTSAAEIEAVKAEAVKKEAEEAAKAEMKRKIDDTKEAARISAEKEAEEKGLPATEKKALIKERVKTAVEALLGTGGEGSE